MLRKLDGNADKTIYCLFFWATGQARYLLCHLIYLSVYCAGGWVERWPQLTTQWMGRSCNPLLNRYLLILRLDLLSQMVTATVFFLIHPKTPPKGSNLDEKGTLVVFYKSATVQSCLSQDLHDCTQCEQGNNLSGKMLPYMKASACS